MIVIIAISILFALVAVFTLYSKRIRTDERVDRELEPPPFGGLFAEQLSADDLDTRDESAAASRLRADLIERSARGDLETLSEAHSTGDARLYDDVLNELIDSTSSGHQNFEALVARISRSNDLRGNRRLAERLIGYWRGNVDRRSTTQMMHIAALSDDPGVYEQAVELVLERWRSGKLQQFSVDELIALFESQYWILALEARRGGAGFALKRKLVEIRRELAAATLTR
jgi:hypothetical protein